MILGRQEVNNTKWNEIFIDFYKNECDKGVLVQWRTKDIETDYSDVRI